ncbi:MAG: hypothetical protein ACOC56_02860 [Atribacterota bacterium]
MKNFTKTNEFNCPFCKNDEYIYHLETINHNTGKQYTANYYCVKCCSGFLIIDTDDINNKAKTDLLENLKHKKIINNIFIDLLLIKQTNNSEKDKFSRLKNLLDVYLRILNTYEFENLKL